MDPEEVGGAGLPGAIVDYNLTLSNTGNISAMFLLSVNYDNWETHLAVDNYELAPGETVEVSAHVLIPHGVEMGDTDTAEITAAAEGQPLASASAVMRTSVEASIFLPLITRGESP